MSEMKLYHIHRSNENNKIWQPNNKIIMKEDSQTGLYKQHMNFNQGVLCQTNTGTQKVLLSELLRAKMSLLQYRAFINQRDMMEILQLLNGAANLSDQADIFKREQALELYRQKYVPHLPSRLHSIYLCDKEGRDYWYDILEGDSKYIFEVKATGNIFKTNEQLLPDEILSYEDTYKQAQKYWEPTIGSDMNMTNEYLVQGEIEVLRRVK